ncbi:MAG: MBOAT family O-acyltransferase [Myxococcota bacterium]
MDLAPIIEALPPALRPFLLGQSGILVRYVATGLAFAALAAPLRLAPHAVRTWGLVGLSLAALALLSLPSVAAIFAAYLVVFYAVVERVPQGHVRSALLVALVAAHALGPIFLLPALPGYQGPPRDFVAFASNLTMLRFWGYAWDRSRRREPETPRFADYALFMTFFPAFLNGPIVTHLEFAERRVDVGPSGVATAFRRLAVGLALGAFTYGVLLSYRDELGVASRTNPLMAWPNAIYTYLWWYLAFSAWTEAAIGLGRLAGVDLPENFDAPHLAWGPADFWRRWNITFMVWLRRFIYLPLGGALIRGRDGQRHLEWRNTFAVFGAVAVYHWVGGLKLLGLAWYPWTAIVPWAVWAAMTGTAVIATRAMKRPAKLGLRGAAVVAATLLFTSVGHMTVMYPPQLPLRGLVSVFRGLVWPF